MARCRGSENDHSPLAGTARERPPLLGVTVRARRPRLAWVVAVAAALTVSAVPAGASAAEPAAKKVLTPTQLASASRAAFLKATSVRVRAKVNVTALKLSAAVDFHVARTACTGVVNYGTLGVAQLRQVGGKDYVSGTGQVWTAITQGDPAAVPGKWKVVAPTDPIVGQLFDLCSWTKEVNSVFPAGYSWVAVTAKTVDGKKTRVIRPAGVLGVANYVAASGTPYIVMQTVKVGWVRFQEWNVPVTVAAPADGDLLP